MREVHILGPKINSEWKWRLGSGRKWHDPSSFIVWVMGFESWLHKEGTMKDIFSNWLHVHFSLDVIMLVILSISQSMGALMRALWASLMGQRMWQWWVGIELSWVLAPCWCVSWETTGDYSTSWGHDTQLKSLDYFQLRHLWSKPADGIIFPSLFHSLAISPS